MKTDIIKKFSNKFSDASSMWSKLSGDFNLTKERDLELFNAMNALGDTISQFVEANAIMAKPDGISIKEALDVLKKNKKKESNEDYAFLVFVLLKNLEDSGLVKVFSRPERIVKTAMKVHAKKRTKTTK